MKKTLIAAGAAGLLAASSLVALADDAMGTITSIDATSSSVTLSDGNVYFLPQNLAALNTFKVGDKVIISYMTDQAGKLQAIEVKPDVAASAAPSPG